MSFYICSFNEPDGVFICRIETAADATELARRAAWILVNTERYISLHYQKIRFWKLEAVGERFWQNPEKHQGRLTPRYELDYEFLLFDLLFGDAATATATAAAADDEEEVTLVADEDQEATTTDEARHGAKESPKKKAKRQPYGKTYPRQCPECYRWF